MARSGLIQVATELQAQARPLAGVQAPPDGGMADAFNGRGGLTSSLSHISAAVGKLADHAAKNEGELEGTLSGMDPEFRPRRDNTIRGDAFDKAGLQVAESRLRVSMETGLERAYEKHNGNPAGLAKSIDGISAPLINSAPEELQPKLTLLAQTKRLAYMRDAFRQQVATARQEQTAALQGELEQSLKGLHQQAYSLGLDGEADKALAGNYSVLEGVLGRNGLDGKPLVSPEQREKILRGARETMTEARVLGAFSRLESPEAKAQYIQQFEQDWQSGSGLAKEFDLKGMRGLRSMLEGEFRRTESERGVIARSLARQVNEVAKNAEKGVMPRVEDMTQLKAAITASNQPELQEGLAAAEATMKWATGARRATPAQLEAWIESEETRQRSEGYKLDSGDVGTLDFSKKLLGEMRKGIKDDPLGWADKVGVVAVPPLSFESGDKFRASLTARMAQAEQIAAMYGQDAVFLRPEEKRHLIGAAAPGGGQLLDIISHISAASGSKAPQVLAEIAGQAPTLALIGGHVGVLGQTPVALDVADGIAFKQAKDAKPVAPQPSAAKTQQWMQETVGSAFGGSLQNERAFVDAANAAYAVRLQRKGVAEDADLWKRTLRELMGERSRSGETYGGIATYQGRKVIVPTDIKQDEFASIMRSIRVEDFGDDPPRHGSGIATQAELRGARLEVRPGNGGNSFYLNVGSEDAPQWLANKDGRPFVLDLAKLKPTLMQRRPDAYWDGAPSISLTPSGAEPMSVPVAPDRPPGMMRLGGPKEPAAASPFQELQRRARTLGFDMDGDQTHGMAPDKVIERAMDEIWRKAPTDENAELIDTLSQKHGLTAPWRKGGK